MKYPFVADMRAFKNRRLTKFEREIRRHHTKLNNGGRGRWRAAFVSENQYFLVQPYVGSKARAEWYRDMMAVALAKFYETTFQKNTRAIV